MWGSAKCCLLLDLQLLLFDYRIYRSILRRAQSVRDLGMILSTNLSPEAHINTICDQTYKLLGFLVQTSRSGINVDA